MSRFNEENAHLYASARAQEKPKGRNKGIMRMFRIAKREQAEARNAKTQPERTRAFRETSRGYTLKNGVWS
jgi:hypothetical protein